MTDGQRFRLILKAVNAGKATNWRQSDNMLMRSTWMFDFDGITVEVHGTSSVMVRPYPLDGNPCIGLSWRCKRLLRALAKQGMVPTHDAETNRLWNAQRELAP